MDAKLSYAQIARLNRIINKACAVWGEPSEYFEPYINDILAKAESYDHIIACFERLIEQAPKPARFAKEWTASPGKLYRAISGHENCNHPRNGNASKKD